MTSRWHVPDDQLAAYLDERVDPPTAASVEAHLVGCADCRSELAVRVGPELTAASWSDLERSIDNDPTTATQRWAIRAGIADRDVRTLAPTISLQIRWVIATALALACAAALARRSDGSDDAFVRLVFLSVAPLAPLAAVVAALSSASEPAPEVAIATPASRLRIGTLRALSVMTASIGIGMAASTALPGDWLHAVVWLLPALALCGLGALVAGRVPDTTAIAGLGFAWLAGVAVAARLTHDRLAAFRPNAQLAYLVVAAAAVLVIAVRDDSLELRSTNE